MELSTSSKLGSSSAVSSGIRWRRPDAKASEMNDVDRSMVGSFCGLGLKGGGCGGEVGAGGIFLDRLLNRFFIRIFVDFSWCSPRICIFSSARELSVDVPILFLSLVSVVPNTLNNRSQVAEFATIERSRSARRKKGDGGHPGNTKSSKIASGSKSFFCPTGQYLVNLKRYRYTSC